MKDFSIAFDTYNPEINDMYFDIVMFENIFTRLISEIKFDPSEKNSGHMAPAGFVPVR